MSVRRIGSSRLAPAFVAATVLALAAVLASATGVAAAGPLSDPIGDGQDGLDIRALDVGTTGADLLVTVDFASDAWATADDYTDAMVVTITTNGDPPVQAEDSEDVFVIGLYGEGAVESVTFNHIQGGRSGPVEMDVATAVTDPDSVMLMIPLAALGEPEEVQLAVEVGRAIGEGIIGGDRVPDVGAARFAGGELSLAGDGAGEPPAWLAPTIAVLAIAAIGGALLAMRARRSGAPRPVGQH